MIALHAEDIRGGLTGRRKLPAAAIGELERSAGVGAAARRVPLVGDRDLLREIQRDCPAAQRRRAAVRYAHVHLEESASRVGRRRRTGIGGKCGAARQQAGQQQRRSDTRFYWHPISHNYWQFF